MKNAPRITYKKIRGYFNYFINKVHLNSSCNAQSSEMHTWCIMNL